MINDLLPNSQKVLIAGIGGGYDILAGMPLYYELKAAGKEVHLFNFSFTDLDNAKSRTTVNVTPEVFGFAGEVTNAPLRGKKTYFPEGYLAEFLKDTIVWAVKKSGVEPVKKAYQALINYLNIDTIVYVDGGIDSIMHGDEEGCATFLEDTVSLQGSKFADVKRILAAIGFGTEIEDGLNHYRALENISTLTKTNGFLGSRSLTKVEGGFKLMKDAYEYITSKSESTSHITPKIIQAIEGEFGGPFFVNILMGMYFFFNPDKVLEQNIMTSEVLVVSPKNSLDEFFEFSDSLIPRMFNASKTWTDVSMVHRSKLNSLKKERKNEVLPL